MNLIKSAKKIAVKIQYNIIMHYKRIRTHSRY